MLILVLRNGEDNMKYFSAVAISFLIALYMGVAEAFGKIWFFDMLVFAVIIIIVVLAYENSNTKN